MIDSVDLVMIVLLALFPDTCYSAQAIVKIMIDLKVGRLDLTADDFIDTRYLPRFCDVVNTFNMLTGTLKGYKDKVF